jgi:hypothetical protein
MPGRKGACIEEIAAPEFAIFGSGLELICLQPLHISPSSIYPPDWLGEGVFG